MVLRKISTELPGLYEINIVAVCRALFGEKDGRFGVLETATVTRPRPFCRPGSGPQNHARASRSSTTLSLDRSLSLAC